MSRDFYPFVTMRHTFFFFCFTLSATVTVSRAEKDNAETPRLNLYSSNYGERLMSVSSISVSSVNYFFFFFSLTSATSFARTSSSQLVCRINLPRQTYLSCAFWFPHGMRLRVLSPRSVTNLNLDAHIRERGSRMLRRIGGFRQFSARRKLPRIPLGLATIKK